MGREPGSLRGYDGPPFEPERYSGLMVKVTSADEPNTRLQSFDLATKRQSQRAATRQGPPVGDCGWKRDDLYELDGSLFHSNMTGSTERSEPSIRSVEPEGELTSQSAQMPIETNSPRRA